MKLMKVRWLFFYFNPLPTSHSALAIASHPPRKCAASSSSVLSGLPSYTGTESSRSISRIQNPLSLCSCIVSAPYAVFLHMLFARVSRISLRLLLDNNSASWSFRGPHTISGHSPQEVVLRAKP